MKHKPSAAIADIGVTQTQLAVGKELGWLFREQPTLDYGIDAQIEVVDGTNVTGRLLAVQIKSGSSFFAHPTADGWWYYPDAAHVEYWTKHALPVMVVFYEPESETCYWQLINSSTLKETEGAGNKVKVLAAQVLNASAAPALREAAEGDPYELRLRQLRLALPWMQLLVDGKRLVIDIDEWVNKTSGRGSISLGIDNEDGEEPEHLVEWGVMLGLESYAEVVPKLFAWADVDVHEETYDEAEYQRWEDEDAFYDEGDKFHRQSYADWRVGLPTGPRPYTNSMDEVEGWRLELRLGDLGKAFMIVDDFAANGFVLLTT